MIMEGNSSFQMLGFYGYNTKCLFLFTNEAAVPEPASQEMHFTLLEGREHIPPGMFQGASYKFALSSSHLRGCENTQPGARPLQRGRESGSAWLTQDKMSANRIGGRSQWPSGFCASVIMFLGAESPRGPPTVGFLLV